MKNATWEYLTEEAKTTEGMTTRQILAFEMFNPNGAYAAKKEADAFIDRLVDAKVVPSGWILAYGGFNDYHYKKLSALISKKGFVKRWDVNYHADKLREDAARAIEKGREAFDIAQKKHVLENT